MVAKKRVRKNINLKAERIRGHIRGVALLSGKSYKEVKAAFDAGTMSPPEPIIVTPLDEKGNLIMPKAAAPRKSKFKIEKPAAPAATAEPVDLAGDVLRCGNPECDKILDKEYPICPHCGVELTWPS